MRSVNTQPSAMVTRAPSSIHAMSFSSSDRRKGPVHLTANRSPLLFQEKLPSPRVVCATSGPEGGAGGDGGDGGDGGAGGAGGAWKVTPGLAGTGGSGGAASVGGA